MKSINNKKNHKNYQNRNLLTRFSKSKYPSSDSMEPHLQ